MKTYGLAVIFTVFEAWSALYVKQETEDKDEAGFIKLINEKFNTGLSLFKGDISDFSIWNKRDINSLGEIVNTNCND